MLLFTLHIVIEPKINAHVPFYYLKHCSSCTCCMVNAIFYDRKAPIGARLAYMEKNVRIICNLMHAHVIRAEISDPCVLSQTKIILIGL